MFKSAWESLVGFVIASAFFGLYLLIAVATIFGIAHSFREHSIGSGVAAIVFPPYAWYRAAEGVFWHDSLSAADWDKTLLRDELLIAGLFSAAGDNSLETQGNLHEILPKFARQIADYPAEKQALLTQFAETYINYAQALSDDMLRHFSSPEWNSAPLNKSFQTLELERQLQNWQAGTQVITDANDGLALLTDMLNEQEMQSKLSAERKLLWLKNMHLLQQKTLEKMRQTFAEIFS